MYMKKKLAIAAFSLLALLVVLPFGLELLTPEKVSEATFHVEGMTCEACEVTLTRAIEKIPGVIKADFSHTQKTGKVLFKLKEVGRRQIVQAIEDKNYNVVDPSNSNDQMKVIDMGVQMQGL